MKKQLLLFVMMLLPSAQRNRPFCVQGKFPNWTFMGKDKTETDRRNNVGRRFMNAYKMGNKKSFGM